MKFNVVVLNAKGIEIDRIVVNSNDHVFALLDAEKIFCYKNLNLEHLDSGMFVGSKVRDLTVLNKDTLQEEYYQLKIAE
ncbi:Uncharacterised protein [Clostridioides difficile]|uniref:hypothetical protein n=1 Tax=Clostridioides difficile TaxID=1496 RepID=UPI00097FF110|nr:hypothetical protein [Clostridioides difficile]SJT87769.1 Uncharacterised protein [Clostridioides difficile]HBF2759675.1 hypothetical protein [Clostridioides difficile]HBF2760088.1 hypothetical protein [Clostridioides difficile]HBF5772899.1 hypothetical protein [Clostridioides difficile]HBF5773232.1 hypothetical protein [Clostridioides difficile]